LNVTIPHKRAAFALVDLLTGTAQAVGAVNTLFCEGGRLVGENTDAAGFLHDLHQFNLPPSGDALVLGAGGSARAVAYALASGGWNVRILSRRAEQAGGLAAALRRQAPGGALSGGQMDYDAMRAARFDLLVNTTPIGMAPNASDCPWPEDIPLPDGVAVYDLVYNPRETELVRRAHAAGLRAATGAGMLAAQAALAFARWTGAVPPFSTMEKAFWIEG
jgi:shikimate dehydrogenase